MAELATARVEVELEAAAAADAARALRGSSTTSSVFTNGGNDDELKLVREAAREQAVQWVAVHPQGRGGGSPDGRGCVGGTPGGLDRLVVGTHMPAYPNDQEGGSA
jgi:hypothetical protein